MRDRMKAIQGLPLLEITAEVEQLAAAILASGSIPQRAVTDAAHIAVASVHGMDFLLTWNCAHIANAAIIRAVADVCRQCGHDCPVICTLEELLGD